MKIRILLLTVLLSCSHFSCKLELLGCLEGTGAIETRIVDLDADLVGVELDFTAELFITEGPVQEISIESYGNIIEAIIADSKIERAVWDININGCSNTGGTKIFVALPKLEVVKLNDAGFISSEGVITNLDDLMITLNDAGRIDLELGSAKDIFIVSNDAGQIEMNLDSATNIFIESNDAGLITLSGKTKELIIECNDAGDVHAKALNSDNCNVVINDASEVKVNVEKSLTGEINDAGVICYIGQPTVNVKVNDGGAVINCN